MIIEGEFSQVGRKTAAANDGLRLQLGRDVDPWCDYSKLETSEMWRKPVKFEMRPKKPLPAACKYSACFRNVDRFKAPSSRPEDEIEGPPPKYTLVQPRSHMPLIL
jgi:hypothetical protein